MEYSIFKDKKSKDTIKRIRKLLDKLNIQTRVKVCEQKDGYTRPYSVRVHATSCYDIGTNGKGVTLENALASGYSEFMERLQNLALGTIKDTIDFVPLNKNNPSIKSFVDFNALSLLQKCSGFNLENDIILTREFLNVLDKKIYNIPDVIITSQGSNGMCAGNTPEEALVQGFCEVCERYALRTIYSNGISLPDIPQEEYLKYDTISDLIQYYKDSGYEISIKDASLGKGLPVVCVVFEDVDNSVFYSLFGSHPSLPVAIERCLTEFAQGFNLIQKNEILKETKRTSNPYFYKNNFRLIEKDVANMSWIWSFSFMPTLERNAYFDKIFFSDAPVYLYSADNFVLHNKKYNNKQLLEFIYKKLAEIAIDGIYVKDVSFLNYPSYLVYVPKISTEVNLEEGNLTRYLNYFKLKACARGIFAHIPTLDEVVDLLTIRAKWGQRDFVGLILEEYLLLLCSILKNDKENIIAYSDFLIDRKEYDENITDRDVILYKIIKDYYSNDCNEEYIKQNYNEEDVKKFYSLINGLNLNSILQLLKVLLVQEEPVKNQKTTYGDLLKVVINLSKKNKIDYRGLRKLFKFAR